MARNWDSLTLLVKTYIFIGGKYKFCGKNSPLLKKTLFVSDFLLNIMKDLSGYVYIISRDCVHIKPLVFIEIIKLSITFSMKIARRQRNKYMKPCIILLLARGMNGLK